MPDIDASPPPSLLGRLRLRFGPYGLQLIGLVALIGIAALVHVLDGSRPWDREVTKRTAQNLALRAEEYGIIGVWWGCLAAAGICTLLLIGAKWWVPGGRIAVRRAAEPPPRSGPVTAFLMLFILAAALWLRAPRLTQSLWNDEEYGMRRMSHGEWVQEKDKSWKFEPVTWSDTLFFCKAGNNHHLNSALNRIALSTWRFCTNTPREEFSEAVLRTPALLAGLLTISLVFVLGCQMGAPWAGAGAAALLALHPWHIRYAVEARGYSLMLFFLCLTLVALIRALRTDRISAWLVFGFAEAGCMLSFAGALYPLVFINLIAMADCLFRREPRRIGTLIGFNLLGAIPAIIWLLPSVPQIAAYIARPDALRLGMEWDWVRDFLSHLLTGAHYQLPEMDTHFGPTWVQQAAAHSMFVPVVGGVLPLLAAAGLCLGAFRGTAAPLILGGITLGSLAAFVQNDAQNTPMVIWYLIYMLIPLTLTAPLLLVLVMRKSTRAQAAAVILLVLLYALATQDVRARIIAHDRQPMRQAVAFIQETHPEAMTAIFGVSDRQTQSYDPRVRVLEKESDLNEAIAAAGAEGRPLYVYFCGNIESAERNPDLMKRVLDPAAFQHLKDFPGLEAMFSYHVYRRLEKAKPPL